MEPATRVTTSFCRTVTTENEYLLTNKSKVKIYNGATDNNSKALKRNMTYTDAFSFIVVGMIGSGMFVSPSLVALRTPNMFVAIIVWIMAGGIALLGALCYSELVSMVKKTGSSYIFILECYGEVPAFVTLWTNVIIMAPCVSSAVAYIGGSYICNLFINDQSSLSFIWYSKLLAIMLFYFTIVLNCVGVKESGKVQIGLVTLQAVIVLLIISMGIYQVSVTKSANNLSPDVMFNNTWSGITENVPVLGAAMFNALFSFDGWYMVAHFVEEIVNPNRNIPLVAFTAIPAVTLLYVVVNVACLMVLSQQELASSTLVVTNVAEKVAGKYLANVIPIFVATGCVGTLIGFCYHLRRFLMSAARERQLPAIFGLIHKSRRTQIPAILFIGFAGTVMIMFAEHLEAVIHYTNIALWIEYPLVISTVIVFRFTKPTADRSYKVWITTPVFMICVSILLLIFSFINTPLGTGMVTLLVLTGVPVCYICVKSNWFSFLQLDMLCNKLMRYAPLVPCEFEKKETCAPSDCLQQETL